MGSGRVLALDVAFKNMGWAIMEATPDDWTCLDAYVISTEKSAKKRGIRVADDDIRRCLELFRPLCGIVEQCGINAIVAEMPTGGSKSSSAAKCMGMAKAVIACVAERYGIPAIWVTPDDGKIAATNKKNASKAQVQRGVLKLYPECTKSFNFKRGSKKEYENKFEHAADAIAGFMSARDSAVLRMLRQ